MGCTAGRRATTALVQALSDADPHVRLEVAKALGLFHWLVAKPCLRLAKRPFPLKIVFASTRCTATWHLLKCLLVPKQKRKDADVVVVEPKSKLV